MIKFMSMCQRTNKDLLHTLNQGESNNHIWNRLYFAKLLMLPCDKKIKSGKDDDVLAFKKEKHDFVKIIQQIGGTLMYEKSCRYGHLFNASEKDKNGNVLYEYMVKIIPQSKTINQGTNQNQELQMIKLLSYFVEKSETPHIVLPISIFETPITHFTHLIKNGYVRKESVDYVEFINGYKNGRYNDMVGVLISESSNRGNLDDYIRKNQKKFEPIHWKVFFFQLISTLAIIQSKFPSFRHNDLRPVNIMLSKINKSVEYYKYKVCGLKYKVPNIGYQIRLFGFHDSTIPGIVDNKSVRSTKNQYYDIFCFFYHIVKNYRLPKEVYEFILSIIPMKYHDNNLVYENEIEYVAPRDILESNPYFETLRVFTLRGKKEAIKKELSEGSEDEGGPRQEEASEEEEGSGQKEESEDENGPELEEAEDEEGPEQKEESEDEEGPELEELNQEPKIELLHEPVEDQPNGPSVEEHPNVPLKESNVDGQFIED